MEQYGAMRIATNPIFGYRIAWIDTSIENWWDNEEIVKRIHSCSGINIEEVKSWGEGDSGKCITNKNVGAICFARADRLPTVIHEIFHAVNAMFESVGGEDGGDFEITAYNLDWTIGELLGDYELTLRSKPEPESEPDKK